MSVTEPVRSSAALLLARLWSRPTPAEIGMWQELWPQAVEHTDALGLPPEGVRGLREALDRSDSESLCDDYERMLVGPGRPPCLPYESAWTGSEMSQREDGILMSVAAEEVQAIYGTLGLELGVDAHELPDHLVVELEAVAYALAHARDDAAAQMLQDHLGRWLRPFCAAVAAQAEEPFYRVLAEVTPSWTAVLGP